MSGKQIDKYPLSTKGENDLLIPQGKLHAGMYYYTLIADGEEVDTKKLIVLD